MAIFIFSGWLSIRSPVWAIAFIVFLTPWAALVATFGVDLRFYQIAMLPITLRIFIPGKNQSYFSDWCSNLLLALFIILSIFISIASLVLLPNLEVEGGFARQSEIRSILQVFMLVLTLIPIWVFPRYLRRIEDIFLIVKVVICSLAILASISLVQLFLWLLTGIDFLPVGIINQYLGGNLDDVRYGGEYLTDTISLYRVNSFGGEPKGLGVSMAMGMILIQTLLVYVNNKKYAIYLNLCWILFAITLFATLSTTAFIVWPLATFISIFFLGSTHTIFILKRFMILICVVAITLEIIDFSIIDVMTDRTFTRLANSEVGLFEDFNDAIIKFLQENSLYILFGTGLGNIHLYADSFLHPLVASYASGTAFVAKMGWLRILSETGIFSLILFIAWLLKLSVSIKRQCCLADHTNIGNIAKTLLITYGFSYLLVGGYAVGIFIIAAGVVMSLYSIMRRYQNSLHYG